MVPFTIMVGYVCKIVFSSLFWVLFDFEFVCFLVGGGYVGYWVYVIVSWGLVCVFLIGGLFVSCLGVV